MAARCGVTEVVLAAERAALAASRDGRTVLLEPGLGRLRGSVVAADGTVEARFSLRWRLEPGAGHGVHVEVHEHRSVQRSLLGLFKGRRRSPGLAAVEEFTTRLVEDLS